MRKDCFSQEFVDAQKFRECAACPLFDECTQTVSLKGARSASSVGRVLGFVAGAGLMLFAATRWPDLPNGSPWLLFIGAVYLVALFRSGREYEGVNADERARLAREAEAKPEGGGPAAAGHH